MASNEESRETDEVFQLLGCYDVHDSDVSMQNEKCLYFSHACDINERAELI